MFPITACASVYAGDQNPASIPQQEQGLDRMAQMLVPAGEFLMGSLANNPNAEEDEKPQHSVYLDSFWIDQTEVTNRMYSFCVADGFCSEPISTGRYLTEKPDHPIQGVTWFQAQKYCEWSGRRLPTEAEWEKAARGPEARVFPWGDKKPSADLANFNFQMNEIVEVGKFPDGASFYDAYDMAGNVWEWVADWYSENYFTESPQRNPMGPSSGNLRVIRGGAWNTADRAIRSANRFWAFPGRDDFNGFRCAKNELD
jgi:formylglycine-generating enzyme required for sulfatase activity